MGLAEKSSVLQVGDIQLNMATHEVTRAGRQIDLTVTEYNLLHLFMSHPGQVLDRQTILNQVWGYDYFGDARTVDTHIRSLRDKLGPYRNRIATVWGTGYRFEAGGAR